jgi:cystathionine beta-lyase
LTPGVVFALAMAVRAFTEPGEAVVVQQPVYYPFSEVVRDNGRRLVNAPLVYDAQTASYRTDPAAFERAVVDNDVKLFLLCNPHNPGGRVWTADELRALGEVCVRHGVTVVSDEIHMDFARPGFSHTVFASLDERFAQVSATCTSAGKTFNLASLQLSNIVIPNADLRRRFRREVGRAGYSQPNVMGLAATEAAYTHGGPWLDALKDYLEGNWALVRSHLAEHAPELRLVESGSTYLAWIDCRALGLDAAGIRALVEDEARLWLDLGDMFGADGAGFIRINIATQRAYLAEALTRLTGAVAARRG